ncbi:MAG: tol-pal system protein YbgF [Pseudomonadota bacterium]|jgi:tol-pal system protein YbgF
MMRWLFALTLLLPLPALAQDAQSLADVKAELAQLAAQFLTLKQELVSSGAAANGSAGGDALQRLDAIEAALTKLTAKTEEVELKLNSVVSDGTNRIGDIEFRLCELTEGCDPSTLPVTPDLGALASGAPAAAATENTAAAPATPTAPAVTEGVELALNEKADFERAKAVLDSGDFLGAADLFKTYAQSYPGGPLVPQADLYRGDALTTAGDTAGAARAFLDAFSASQTGPLAGQSLTKLGQSLGKLGQGPEACVTLAEVGKRFPGSADEATAKAAMAAQGCP